MLSHITNTTRFEICHVMKFQLWIGKTHICHRGGHIVLEMSCENPDFHILQGTSGWIPAQYRLYKPFNFFVITLCDNLQTLVIMTPESEERTEKELHVQDTVFQKILYLCLRLI